MGRHRNESFRTENTVSETTIKRCFRSSELRINATGGKETITGLAVPWNAPSEDLGGFREVFQRDAFDLSGEMFADIEHDHTRKLGRTGPGTLRFRSSPEGLRFEVDVPNTTVGRDALEEVRNGTLDAASIAFTDPVCEWRGPKNNLTRHISKATLQAVTLTSFPAYPQTAGTVTQRALEAYRSRTQHEDFQPGTDTLRRRLDLIERGIR